MPIRILKKNEDTNREKGLKKSKMLSGGQAKLDKNKNNKIDAQDFKILRAEKAKGRGQGLQDEKMKPGKVMKAKRGKAVQGTTAKSSMGKTFQGYQKVFKTGVSAGDKAKATSTIIGVKPKLPEASKKSKIARRALRAAQATRLGKMILPVAAAGVAAQQYLKSKMKKKEDKNKKMGGGMMNRPMGYKKGSPENPMKEERFQQTRQAAIAKVIGKENVGDPRKVERPSKKNKVAPVKKTYMGGGMMKVPGYSSGTGKTVTIKDGRIALTDPNTSKERPKERRVAQQPKRSVGRKAGIGALGGSGNKSETINLMKNKIYKYKAKKDSGFTDKQVSMQKDIKEKFYKRKSGEKRLGKIFDASPTVLSKAGITGSGKSIGMPGHSIMTTSSKGKTKLNYARPYGGTIETGFKGYDERTPGMGLKTGKSIKVKCKLGRNKPTKMY